ncbi:ABC transporter permease [Elioraea sp.]|uniref:ABC transporter permease n=1 Tax=Elioraea sp. TaxID=2185103 RepID=UPI003F6EAE37
MLNSLRPSRRDWRLAATDLVRGAQAWPTWVLLGASDIRQRYRRSRIGQFWITISLAVFVASIGSIYALLFRQPAGEYIPTLAVNFVVWSFISGTITDSTATFVQAAGYLRQDALPKTIFVLRALSRNVIILAHNVIVIPVVFLLFLVMPNAAVLLVIPGLVLLLAAGFAAVLIFSILSTRFRDLPQIIQSLLQIAFFLTPVMWRPEQLPDSARFIVDVNPFAAFLRIVAEPILGRVPDALAYANALAVTAILFALALPLFARFRARIVYWI